MMSNQTGAPPTRIQVTRRREGSLLGGVCAGLPDIWGLGTNGLRVIFVLTALLGGIGVVAYCACWLVIPAADSDPDGEPARGVVVVAWAAGGLVAAVLIAAISALATAFGLGWAVFALAAITLVVLLIGRRYVPPLVALATLASLTLPATAVALSPVHLSLDTGNSAVRPASASTLAGTTYRSGLGMMLIDLRQTRLPASGTVTMHVDAGLRRTIVALPHDRCVHVQVSYSVNSFGTELAALLSGRSTIPFHGIVLFGRVYGANGSRTSGAAQSSGPATGPTLQIDFDSQGGSLYVRDFPDSVDPDLQPNWPGYVVTPEPYPSRQGEPRKLWPSVLRAWQARHRAQIANQRYVNSLIGGPCAS